MHEKLTWTDAEDIGICLYELNPDLNPLGVRFTDMHAMICKLPEFEDNPKASNEARLEAIQMAWLEEFNENQ